MAIWKGFDEEQDAENQQEEIKVANLCFMPTLMMKKLKFISE